MSTAQEHTHIPCQDFYAPLFLFSLFDKFSYNILAFGFTICDGMFCSSSVARRKQMHHFYIRR